MLVDGNMWFFIEGIFLIFVNGDRVIMRMYRVVPILLRFCAERFPFGLLLILLAHEF